MSNISSTESIHSSDESSISDSETINSNSEISEDESIYSSDEEFIDNEDVSTEEESSDEEYIPPYKRQNLNVNENKYKVEIIFDNGEWVLKVINNV